VACGDARSGRNRAGWWMTWPLGPVGDRVTLNIESLPLDPVPQQHRHHGRAHPREPPAGGLRTNWRDASSRPAAADPGPAEPAAERGRHGKETGRSASGPRPSPRPVAWRWPATARLRSIPHRVLAHRANRTGPGVSPALLVPPARTGECRISRCVIARRGEVRYRCWSGERGESCGEVA
jgi:hypothetical protein